MMRGLDYRCGSAFDAILCRRCHVSNEVAALEAGYHHGGYPRLPQSYPILLGFDGDLLTEVTGNHQSLGPNTRFSPP